MHGTEKGTVMLRTLALPAFASALLAGCVAPVGPVEVTRFHVPDAQLAQGSIAVQPAPGSPEASIEQRTYESAVARELGRIGYSGVGPSGSQVAEVRLMRRSWQPERRRGPVSVGVGGGGGSWGSFGGVGVGLDLSPPPKGQIETLLGVMIKERSTGRTLWEGRAEALVPVDSPLAAADVSAARLAEALFRDFPGRSGETILVR
jgi:hypothetical protein